MIYPLFGSWPHGSLGPFAIAALMTGSTVRNVMALHHPTNGTDIANEEIMPDFVSPTAIVTTLTFTMGILLFAVFRLEFLATYLSEPFIGGFTTAAAMHVLLSQLDGVLGLHKRRGSGPGYLFREIRTIFRLLPHTNWATLVISMLSVLFLSLGKFVVNPLLKKAFPQRLIIIVLVTVVAYFAEVESRFAVRVVGEVPRSLPEPRLPLFGLIPDVFWSAVAIVVVNVAVHLSVAKLMCRRVGYKIDENQELYAAGITLTTCGFFPVFPPANGLFRSLVIHECGGKTLMTSFIAGGLLLVVLLVMGPLFQALPLCVLSAIILVALRHLLVGLSDVPQLWRSSTIDFSIWMVSFWATIVIDVIGGFGVALAFELLTVVLRTQWPSWRVRFTKEKSIADVCVFQFDSPLLFTNCERFKKNAKLGLAKWNMTGLGHRPRIFVFDCSALTAIDFMGVRSLSECVVEMRAAACTVWFAGANDELKSWIVTAEICTSSQCFFETVNEAMQAAKLPMRQFPTIVPAIGIEDKREPFSHL
ncbi:CRE-SULP-5 protein [Aphelenchoides avenae]|nr:CRE-SULP-5 protein [Aphelenchus avenae]